MLHLPAMRTFGCGREAFNAGATACLSDRSLYCGAAEVSAVVKSGPFARKANSTTN